MEIRSFTASDLGACLTIFDSNSGRFTDENRQDYAAFLGEPQSQYLVMEHEGQVVGCGGYYLQDQRNARLVWGMVRKDLQGQGLGRYLLLYRVREVAKLDHVERVSLTTSAQAAGFFEGQGFKVTGESEGLVSLTMKLTVCG